ncbi:MAG: hypothetical protein AAB446_01525 [Patescibacteria group bacterium]
MPSSETVRRKKSEIVSLFKKEGVGASVGITRIGLEYGLKIGFNDKIPSSVMKKIPRLLQETPCEFEFVGTIKPRGKIIE